MIPLLKVLKEEEKYIVISSQVPIDIYDFEYDTGRRLLELGAIPSGALSFTEAQVRLAYILGHQKEIAEVLSKNPTLDERQVITASFLAGVQFRKLRSKIEYIKIYEKMTGGRSIRLPEYDPFSDVAKTFAEALSDFVEYQI